MAEEEKIEAQGIEEGDEEIIEKKPMAPTATVLMILTTIFLGLSIYLVGDELSYYFKRIDYDKDRRADWYYTEFKRRDARPEHAEEVEPGAPGASGQR